MNKNTLMTAMAREYNYTFTANGALTHKTTFSDVLDLFYHAPAKRGHDNTELFASAYAENAALALKTIFYVRDIRGGQGERETFRQALRWLYNNDRMVFNAVVDLVPIYGRWDDVLEYVDNSVVRNMVHTQLLRDQESDRPSLLAKWMPSANTSSQKTVKLARKWMNALNLTEREYRKLLSGIRSKIVLVETLMSSQAFDEINYEHVPSRAAALYRKAFAKRDSARYAAYIAAVNSGEKKINASTLYPYELVQQYANRHNYSNDVDQTIEALWRALPNYADTDDNALVVCDVSGSMMSNFYNPKVRPIDVSVSLAIYIAERNHGAFANNFITFSANPKLITLKGKTLLGKVQEVYSAGVGYNTNIQAVFDMILRVAVKNNVPQGDMPKKIFMISDMEFDDHNVGGRATNFEVIKRKFEQAEYEMPTLVFWNVNSANKQTPVTMDQSGAYLISGSSPSVFKTVVSSKSVTPFDMMLEVINSDRYAPIDEVLELVRSMLGK